MPAPRDKAWWLPPTFVCAVATVLLATSDLARADAALNGALTAAIFSSTRSYARSHGLPLSRDGLLAETNYAAGPAIVMLIDRNSGEYDSQWICVLRQTQLTAEEKSVRPPVADIVRYTTTGTELRFKSTSLTAVTIRLIGPFDGAGTGHSGSSVADAESRLLIDPTFLSFGLDRTCQTWLDLRKEIDRQRTSGRLAENVDLPLATNIRPFPESVTRQTSVIAQELGFTPRDEYSFYGAEFAISSFAKIINTSSALREIVEPAITPPSFLSRLKHLGTEWRVASNPSDITSLDNKAWQLQTPIYQLPFTLQANDESVLSGDLAVTAPNGSLLLSGGIIALEAASTASSRSRFFMRVLWVGYANGS